MNKWIKHWAYFLVAVIFVSALMPNIALASRRGRKTTAQALTGAAALTWLTGGNKTAAWLLTGGSAVAWERSRQANLRARRHRAQYYRNYGHRSYYRDRYGNRRYYRSQYGAGRRAYYCKGRKYNRHGYCPPRYRVYYHRNRY